MAEEGLLAPYRVLDLTDEKGYLCGRILGDLGADVIKIEPPAGDSGRRIGPFYHDIPDPENSLFFWAYNFNKRGITLNLETEDGRKLLRRLVTEADFVIESFKPGYLDGLGVGYSELSKINPRLVVTSISPFGQTGPYKDYEATDLIGMAMGGMMSVTGDDDRPPVRVGAPQAWVLGSTHAAGGTMIAHHYRAIAGEGQHVDVSIQQAVILTLLVVTGYPLPEFGGSDFKRAGALRRRGPLFLRQLYPCKDGYISVLPMGGAPGAKSMKGLISLMDELGIAPQWMKERDWAQWDIATLVRRGPSAQAEIDAVESAFRSLFERKTMAELYKAALEKGILVAPVSTAEDLLADPQLQARDFWVEVDHPEIGVTVTYPGPFIQGSRNIVQFRRRAPRIGEHNMEVYRELLGLNNEQIVEMRQIGAI